MWSVGQLSALREKISLSMHRRGKQRGRLWLCSRNVPTMEKRDFTAKEKDRSFAVEEVGGDPPTWEDEDEVNQVDGQRKLFTICGGHPYGVKLLVNRAVKKLYRRTVEAIHNMQWASVWEDVLSSYW